MRFSGVSGPPFSPWAPWGEPTECTVNGLVDRRTRSRQVLEALAPDRQRAVLTRLGWLNTFDASRAFRWRYAPFALRRNGVAAARRARNITRVR